jgi:hypothetical protein
MWEFNFGVFWAILAALFVRGLYRLARWLISLARKSPDDRPTTLDDIAELLSLRM